MYDIQQWLDNLKYMVKEWFSGLLDKMAENPAKTVGVFVIIFSIVFLVLFF